MLATDFTTWLSEEKRTIDAALNALLPPAHTFPGELHAAMRAAVLNGGKRLRAALLRALCAALGTDPSRGTTVGCAVECYHAATLVLDDLPCMDDADTRRGSPALHRRFNEATAILAAEGLMMLAFRLMSRPGQTGLPADAPVSELVARLAEATGGGGLMAGQYLDLLYETQPADVQMLETIHARKTGRLFAYCAHAAAALAHAPEAAGAAAVRFTEAFGLAFQISDDLLDATGEAGALGKPTGQDANKSTYVSHFGVAGAREQLAAAIAAAQDALAVLPGDTAPLHAMAEFLGTRQA